MPSRHQEECCHQPAGRIDYSGDMRPGPVQLRVWQLSFRSDFGLANMIDPDELELLVEMILLEGFLGQIG